MDNVLIAKHHVTNDDELLPWMHLMQSQDPILECYTFDPDNGTGLCWAYPIAYINHQLQSRPEFQVEMHMDQEELGQLMQLRGITAQDAQETVIRREASSRKLYAPLIAVWGNRSVVIDGNHRLVYEGLRGQTVFHGHAVPQEVLVEEGWCFSMPKDYHDKHFKH